MIKSKKFLCLMLALCMVLTFMPVFTQTGYASAADVGIQSDTASIAVGDKVYFGTYPQSAYTPTTAQGSPAAGMVYTDTDGTEFFYSGSAYFKMEPIEWRVLSNTGSELFLLSEKNIDAGKAYNTTFTSVTWESCTFRIWLNGLSGNPYTYSFLDLAFSAEEQAAILTTKVSNPNNPKHDTNGGNETNDKVFLLSIQEAEDATLGFKVEADRIAVNTGYTASFSGKSGVGIADKWWLRSPGSAVNSAVPVYEYGYILDGGYGVDYAYAARPAFNLNLSSVIFTSAAAGGKSTATVGSGLSAAEPPTGAVKFTVEDLSLTLASVTPTSVNGRTITFGYTGAAPGNTLSAAVMSDTDVLRYYGKLQATTAASGTGITVTVPDGFAATDELQIFVEECNDYYYTDFAGIRQQITVAEQTAPVGLAGVTCTTTADDDGKITGTTTAMEYSANSGATWTAAAGTEITGLTPGSYQVRFAGKVEGGTAYMASPVATLTVSAAPTYGVSLSETGTYTFTSATFGYVAQTARTVTVDNTGNQATGALTVVLSGTNAADFTLSKASITDIAVSGSDSFTVVPNTGLGVGTYIATVTVSGGNGISAAFNVSFTVTAAAPRLVTSIAVTGAGGANTITTDGGTLQMSATVLPADADNTTVTWSTITGTGGATISATGLLTALANGTVTVRATANDGTSMFGDLLITITGQTPPAVPVTSVTVTGAGGADTITTNGGTLQMLTNVLPVTATIQSVTWTVTNGTGTATISTSGLLTATGNGTVTARATANDGSGISGELEVTISGQTTTPITYTITFNANSGSVTPATAQTGTDGKLSSLPTPTRSGSYRFDGWFTAASGGTQVTTSYVFTANITIYAQWTYTGGDGNGGGGNGGGGTSRPADSPTTPPATTRSGDSGQTSSFGNGIIIDTPPGQDPIDNDDGSITVPGGGIITMPDTSSVSGGSGTTFIVPPGTAVTQDGEISFPKGSGGGMLTLSNGLTFNVHEDAVIMLDTDTQSGYSISIDNPFEDVNADDWFFGSAMFAYSHGLMVSTSTNPMLFSPNMATTRGMVVTVLYRMAGSPSVSGYANPFGDVASDSWYTDAVIWAAANGIVFGIGGDQYAPDSPMSRQDLAVILARYANYMSIDLPSEHGYPGFIDGTDTSAYAATAVEQLYRAGIINGYPDGSFKPQGEASRAEFAEMLKLFIEAFT